jgi:hypothetical protein
METEVIAFEQAESEKRERASPESAPLKLTVVAAEEFDELARSTVTAPEQEPAATVCAAVVISRAVVLEELACAVVAVESKRFITNTLTDDAAKLVMMFCFISSPGLLKIK